VSKVDKQLEEFKSFVRKYPGLKTAVRDGRATWQTLFEEWYLYGESDSQWDKYKNESSVSIESKVENETKNQDSNDNTQAKSTSGNASGSMSGTEMMSQALQYVQKMDMNKVQQTMGTVQQFIQIFQTMQGGKGGGAPGPAPKQSFPGLFSKFDD